MSRHFLQLQNVFSPHYFKNCKVKIKLFDNLSNDKNYFPFEWYFRKKERTVTQESYPKKAKLCKIFSLSKMDSSSTNFCVKLKIQAAKTFKTLRMWLAMYQSLDYSAWGPYTELY